MPHLHTLTPSSSLTNHITFIGDVHGCYRSFTALLKKIPQTDNQVVLMGDIINKGKRSYEVFEFVKRNRMVQLLGNHEFYCIHRNKPEWRLKWLRQGGGATIQSIRNHFGRMYDTQLQVVLAEMAYAFREVKPYLIVETAYRKKFIATHGGLSQSTLKAYKGSIGQALAMDLNLPTSYLFNKTDLASLANCSQVIGHQPTEKDKIIDGKNYKIDTGCVYLDRNGMGWLTAVMFNIRDDQPPHFFHQVNID